jgi:hypothetical protein
MGPGELILRGIIFISLIPSMVAVVVYFRGSRSAAMKWNAVFPILVIAGALLAMLSQPLEQQRINLLALSLFAIPIVEILLCLKGARLQNPFLFWSVWLVNAAILSAAVYLAFVWRIQF